MKLNMWLFLLASSAVPIVAGISARGRSSCQCSRCKGERQMTDFPSSGYRGVQCVPLPAFHQDSCLQPGEDQTTWAVQNSRSILLAQFCLLTCRPVFPENVIAPKFNCAQLTGQEIRSLVQTESGNGRAFIYHFNPMSDTLPLSALPRVPLHTIDEFSLMKEAMKSDEFSLMKATKPACQECSCPTQRQEPRAPQIQGESDVVSLTQPVAPPPLPPVLPSPLPVPPEAQTPLPPLPLSFPSISDLEGADGPGALSKALTGTSQTGPPEVAQQIPRADVGAPSLLQSRSVAVRTPRSDSHGACHCPCGRDHNRDRMGALLEAQRNAERERREEGVPVETSKRDNASGFLQSVGIVPPLN
mmetsp:Transcript_62450/g.165729  ORF Transcript_62450/g.165729 Transcript_62450/m.165729 type:complete len:358 (-) Transcript_62450:139-1212(-)